jgi:hypothetical protein
MKGSKHAVSIAGGGMPLRFNFLKTLYLLQRTQLIAKVFREIGYAEELTLPHLQNRKCHTHRQKLSPQQRGHTPLYDVS